MKLEAQGGEQIEALQKKLMRWTLVAPEEVRKALVLGAQKVREEAQRKHFRKPKMPRGVGDPENAWLGTASGTWTLRNRIIYKVTARPGEFSAVIFESTLPVKAMTNKLKIYKANAATGPK